MTTEATCERCDGLGWNLRDARIDVCGCGVFDPPKWVTRGDTACVLAHHRDPERPRRAAVGYLCSGHHARLEQLIAELPALYDDLGVVLTAAEGPATDRVSSSREPGLNLNRKVLDAREEIHAELVRMTLLVVEARVSVLDVVCPLCGAERGLGCRATDEHVERQARAQQVRIKLLPADTVPALATWLGRQVDWLAAQPDVDETHDNLTRLRGGCWRLAYPTGAHRLEIGPCGTGECPGVLWLWLRIDEDEGRTMACDDCGRTIEPRYWRAERRRIDGADVNPWLPLDVAAVQYGVSLRTVQRWVTKGRLKSRGTPPLVRASAVEGLIHALQVLRRPA